MRTILGLLTVIAIATSANAWQTGDVDHSGYLDCYDAQLILNYVAYQDASKLDVSLADVSGGGGITAYDASLLQIMCAGCKGVVYPVTNYDVGGAGLPTNSIMNSAFPNAALGCEVRMRDENDLKIRVIVKKTVAGSGGTWCVVDGTSCPN